MKVDERSVIGVDLKICGDDDDDDGGDGDGVRDRARF